MIYFNSTCSKLIGKILVLYVISLCLQSINAAGFVDKKILTAKAVVIIKLSLFVLWPKLDVSTKTICLDSYNSGGFGGVVDDVINAKSSLKKLVNFKYVEISSENKAVVLSGCQIFFLNKDSFVSHSTQYLSQYYPEVLFVTDSIEYLDKGYQIAVVFENDGFVLYSNTAMIKASRLQLKSSLLKLIKNYQQTL